MVLFRLSVLAVILYVQLSAVASSQSEDGEGWSLEKWQVDPVESDLTLRFADLLKRSKTQQFHGLMGRSSGPSQPLRLGGKRTKGEMFVGLMGRRSSNGGEQDFQDEMEKPEMY